MKNEKPINSGILKELPILKNISVLETIKCSNGNHGSMVCCKNGCKNYPFMCGDRKCACRANHQNCMIKAQVLEFIEKFQNRIIDLSSLVDFHSNQIEKTIKKFSFQMNQLKDLFRQQVSEKLKVLSFSEKDLEFLIKVQQNKVSDMNGEDFFKVYEELNLEKENDKKFNEEKEVKVIKRKWKYIQDKVLDQIQNIEKMWKQNRKKSSFYDEDNFEKQKYQKDEQKKLLIKQQLQLVEDKKSMDKQKQKLRDQKMQQQLQLEKDKKSIDEQKQNLKKQKMQQQLQLAQDKIKLDKQKSKLMNQSMQHQQQLAQDKRSIDEQKQKLKKQQIQIQLLLTEDKIKLDKQKQQLKQKLIQEQRKFSKEKEQEKNNLDMIKKKIEQDRTEIENQKKEPIQLQLKLEENIKIIESQKESQKLKLEQMQMQVQQKAYENQKKQQLLKQCQLMKSTIITKTNECQNILNFFGNKEIQIIFNIKYRASQNKFSTNQFHKNVDGIKNTLILVKTEYDKIIGGFTNNKWKKIGSCGGGFFSSGGGGGGRGFSCSDCPNAQYLADASNLTFLFSLTNNQKLQINNKNAGIINNSHYGPAFGYQNSKSFFIGQNQNQYIQSFVSFGGAFVHPNYKENNEQTFKRFTGSKTKYFKIKEWQVWQVIFK